jgi:Fe-S-cluster containining protein
MSKSQPSKRRPETPTAESGDGLIRDLPLIRRYARHNEAQDYRFRAYVKSGLNLSNTELDTVVHEATDTVWKDIDCTTCGNCCRTALISVDDKDIQRLATRLSLTIKQFAQRYVQTAPDRSKYFATVPCPFLGEDNYCSVYEDRPQSCRDFPYLYHKGFRQYSLTMAENVALCPIVFNVWQALKKRFPLPKSFR